MLELVDKYTTRGKELGKGVRRKWERKDDTENDNNNNGNSERNNSSDSSDSSGSNALYNAQPSRAFVPVMSLPNISRLNLGILNFRHDAKYHTVHVIYSITHLFVIYSRSEASLFIPCHRANHHLFRMY